ncbi:MAG: VOC family protein [Hyphomicrobiales bacterium]|nr:VOC family protein [Hyphomicrobiales bacterium]
MIKRSPITPSLYASDLPMTIRFYTGKLGFEHIASYRDEDGTEIWAEVARGDARIWFFTPAFDEFKKPVFSGLIYIFVDDVDAFAAGLDADIKTRWGPETQDYGLREIGIEDCNGYLLCFAKDV